MSALVESLRDLAQQVRPFDPSQALTYSDCADELDKAADEIERLRAVVEAARHVLADGDKLVWHEPVYHLEKALAALEDSGDGKRGIDWSKVPETIQPSELKLWQENIDDD